MVKVWGDKGNVGVSRKGQAMIHGSTFLWLAFVTSLAFSFIVHAAFMEMAGKDASFVRAGDKGKAAVVGGSAFVVCSMLTFLVVALGMWAENLVTHKGLGQALLCAAIVAVAYVAGLRSDFKGAESRRLETVRCGLFFVFSFFLAMIGAVLFAQRGEALWAALCMAWLGGMVPGLRRAIGGVACMGVAGRWSLAALDVLASVSLVELVAV